MSLKWSLISDTGEETVWSLFRCPKTQGFELVIVIFGIHLKMTDYSVVTWGGIDSAQSLWCLPEQNSFVSRVLFWRYSWNGHFSVTLWKRLHIHCSYLLEHRAVVVGSVLLERWSWNGRMLGHDPGKETILGDRALQVHGVVFGRYSQNCRPLAGDTERKE